MALHNLVVECPVHDSFRVRQVAGLFDVPIEQRAAERFAAEVPDLMEPWDIGVIVGPSGSGKSTIAKAAFGDALYSPQPWPDQLAVIDCFGDLPIKRIAGMLTAVGLSSPPTWLKPHAVLSNGEKFRCELARALLRGWPVIAFDEFTSVVDRTVARIASAAIAKALRSRLLSTSDPASESSHSASQRFVAVTCHYDVVEWLEPDWVLDMASQKLARGRLRRPRIELEIRRADRSIWPLFKRHHYLSGELHRSAQCFVGTIDGRPAVFTAVLPHPHPRRPGWREHRTVCHPDFQGVGIGNAMSEFVASLFVAGRKPYFSTTGHPGMIAHRARSPLWRSVRRPGIVGRQGRTSSALGMQPGGPVRITAGFEYVGPPRPVEAAALRAASV